MGMRRRTRSSWSAGTPPSYRTWGPSGGRRRPPRSGRRGRPWAQCRCSDRKGLCSLEKRRRTLIEYKSLRANNPFLNGVVLKSYSQRWKLENITNGTSGWTSDGCFVSFSPPLVFPSLFSSKTAVWEILCSSTWYRYSLPRTSNVGGWECQ